MSEREDDLERELRAHLDLEAEEQGDRDAARRSLGNVTLIKEVTREMWGWSRFEQLIQDLRFAARTLRRSPGFTAVAVLSLGLGIGANTTIFTFLNAVVLRALPYPNANRVVILFETDAKRTTLPVHPLNFVEWRARTRSFEALTLVQSIPANIRMPDGAEQVPALWCTSELFQVFGVEPMLGRAFTPGETTKGSPPVIILSHDFWQRRFGGDTGIIGKQLVLDGGANTIVGVAPAGFRIASMAPDLYLPMPLDPGNPGAVGSRSFLVYGRLKDYISLATAQAEMSVIGAQLANQYPIDKGMGASVLDLHEYLMKDGRPILFLLMGMVSMVLLIACVNLASLLLTRGIGRRNELAVRASLGAGRGRLIRQLFAESLLLSGMGAAFGLLWGHWATKLLLALSKTTLTFGGMNQVELDSRVLGFTLALATLTALLFGLLPAWNASRIDLNVAMKAQGRGASGDRRSVRLQGALVIGEVALAVVLLVGAGLLLRTFSHLLEINLGFQPQHVLTLRLFLGGTGGSVQRADLVERILQRVETLHDVLAVGTIQYRPIDPTSTTGFRFEGDPGLDPSHALPTQGSLVSRGYFAAMGIPVLQGRAFGPQDRMGSARVVLVNQSFAKKYLPDGRVLGRVIVVAWSNQAPTEIVGVVGDVRHNGMTTEPAPTVYLPHAQTPGYITHLMVRTAGDPAALAAAIRHEIHEVDPARAVAGVKRMEDYVSEEMARPRLYASLLTSFAGLALLLAGIGLYGLISYAVSQRTHEIGIRVALGAQRAAVLRMVLKQGAALAVAGLILGSGAALLLSRLVSGLLYGVTTRDPVTYSSVALVLGGVAILAAYVPARRAARVDPMVALRYE